jgi:hypothetical protein
MPDVAVQLDALRRRIGDGNDPGTPADFTNRLAVNPSGAAFDLDFYGDAFGESYTDLLETLARPDVAPHIRSVVLRGPDEGANGTQNWDLEPLLANGATFARLEMFTVRQNKPGDHNRAIVGRDYDEDGMLGRLLAKAQALRELTVPSAPGANFFEAGSRPIRLLNVDAGYATQSFIGNLAASSAFRDLYSLEWGEYNETYMDDFRANCTPLEEYRTLFASETFRNVRRFVWRNPVCSPAEIVELKKLRGDLQLLVVRTSAEYVR